MQRHYQSQPSTSLNDDSNIESRAQGSHTTLDILSSHEQNQTIRNIVKYLLVLDRTKQVTTKHKIIKNVLCGSGKQFSSLFPKVKQVLHQVFGYKIIEWEQGKYMLINAIPNKLPHIHLSKEHRAQQVLLFIVLTHIFMNAESCTEGVLYDFLKHLNIVTQDNFHHYYFGDVKELISETFVHQKYLDKVIYQDGDPPKVEYKWGLRAEHEFTRRSALEFISKVYYNRPLTSWTLQYKMVLAKENAKKNGFVA